MSNRLGDSREPSSSENNSNNTSMSTNEEESSSGSRTPVAPVGAINIAAAKGTVIENNPNDEMFHVEDDRNICTPPQGGRNPATSLGSGSGAVGGGELLPNNPNDERLPVHNSDVIPTPRAMPESRRVGTVVENSSHDERIPVESSEATNTAAQSMALDDEEESAESESDEEDETNYQMRNIAGQRPDDIGEAVGSQSNQPVLTSLEYNSAKYEKVNESASYEMKDLFKLIGDYRPFVAELPAKLRPFIPDYIPAVGDLDPFVKVPRPDGRPDGLGLYVIDEPTIPQSNPAVVQLELRATNVHGAGSSAQVVDSFEDAANRPEVIDRWIADVKKVHYKKALPTVNYQRPMPEIETLMQLWPEEFETMLNSDVQFPPSHIDLDMDQYVRTLCAIADIPTYNSLIDSLHVLFTIYQDFRTNQHFQHE